MTALYITDIIQNGITALRVEDFLFSTQTLKMVELLASQTCVTVSKIRSNSIANHK